MLSMAEKVARDCCLKRLLPGLLPDTTIRCTLLAHTR
jgi:hypothetical protein